jgi:hypothetical protein
VIEREDQDALFQIVGPSGLLLEPHDLFLPIDVSSDPMIGA